MPPAAAPGSTPQAKPTVNHPLWTQAEAAERDGRFDEAEKLYFQLARVMNEPGGDHDVANLCYTRIHMIREKKRGGPTSSRGVDSPRGASSGVQPAALTASSTPTTRDDRDSRATLLPPVAERSPTPRPESTRPTTPPEQGDEGPRWSGPGTLQRTVLSLDGRQTYALETGPGAVRIYAVGDEGVDLSRYWKRKVDLYGTVQNHPNASKPYMVVTKVEPNP
jgi:hypothetical protein